MTNPNRPVGAGLGGGGLWPAHLPRPQAPVSSAAPPEPTTPEGRAEHEVATARLPWTGVQWTMVYIGLLGYVFATTTYRLPIGDVSMVIAAVGLLTQREKFRLPGLLIGLGIFLIWCVIGYSITREPVLVLDRLKLVAKVWVVGVVAANALRSRPQIRFFVVFWLASFALYPLRGSLFNYYVYHETLYGRAKWNYIYSNPNDLAAYCILALALALGLLALEKRGPVKLATIAGLAVVPFVIILTRSRGAFLGFAAFVLFVILGHKKRGKALMVTAILAVIVIGVAPKGVLDRVQGLEKVQGTDNLEDVDSEGSAYQRFEIWKIARTIIRDYPVAGVGLGAYPAAHAFYARRPEFDPTARGRRDTHSTYLNLTAETGFVGLTLYLLAYITTFLQINAVRRRIKSLMPMTSQSLYVYLAGTTGFFVAAIFGSMAHVSFLVLQVVVTWCLAEVADREFRALTSKRHPGSMHVVRGVTARAAV